MPPWSQRRVGPLQGHHPKALSLWGEHILQALTISLSIGRTGFLSHIPSSSAGPFAALGLICGNGSPLSHTAPYHSSLPGPELLPKKVRPRDSRPRRL